MNKKITIAIDGHSSTGKSTVAKQLAKEFNYIYVDTGAMYRAVTYFAMESDCFKNEILSKECLYAKLDEVQIQFKKEDNQQQAAVFLNGRNVEPYIRGMEVSSKVSSVAQLAKVREKLVEIQQQMGKNKGIVMDGRDIGTVVFPNADVKLFMTASADIRAKRRYDELKKTQPEIDYENVYQNVVQRDEMDSNRAHSPLKMADDAIKIDNSNLTEKQQLKLIINLINSKLY